MAKTFHELDAFKVATQINDEVWEMRERIQTKSPGTWYQLDRSAGSISDNIAEGFGRESPADFANFLRYSRGSAMEVQSQIARSRRRELITAEEARQTWDKLERVSVMLSSLRRYLKGLKKSKGNMLREEPAPYGEEYWPDALQIPDWWDDEIDD